MMPNTCEDIWHVSHAGHKRCDCGETRNPSYRTWYQRWRDRRQRRRLK